MTQQLAEAVDAGLRHRQPAANGTIAELRQQVINQSHERESHTDDAAVIVRRDSRCCWRMSAPMMPQM